MVFADLLGVELDTGAPDHGVLELPDHTPMDFVTEIFDGGVLSRENDGCIIVRVLPFGLRVNSDQIEVLPGLLDQLVHVPFQISGDRHVVVDLVQNVQLVEGNGVDFVEGVEAGDVLSVSLDDVDDVILGSIAFEADIAVVDLILFENGLDGLVVYLGGVD